MTALQDIVSSRVKAELFRILFGLRRPELHLRELARQSGLALGTIQQELRRLTRSGIINSRKDGNRVYYRANDSHPLHSDLSSLVLKTDGLLGTLESALTDKSIDVAFIFGSVAADAADANSDVDLMIIGHIGLRRLTGLLSGLGLRIGREINPHILSPEEFASARRRHDHFLSSVLTSPKLFIKGTDSNLAAMGE